MPNIVYRLSIAPDSVTKDIAEDLIDRMYYGKTVIVVDEPKVFIATIRKQWLKLLRRMQVERARTLDPTKTAELDGRAHFMKGQRFTIRYPLDEHPGDVYIVSLPDALAWAPDCSTLYIVAQTQVHERYLLSSWMPNHGTVVIYAQK